MTTHWVDPVVEEVRARGRAYTERLQHDIHAIAEDIRRDQRENRDRYVVSTTDRHSKPDMEARKS